MLLGFPTQAPFNFSCIKIFQEKIINPEHFLLLKFFENKIGFFFMIVPPLACCCMKSGFLKKKSSIFPAVAGSVCLSTPFKLMERPFLRDVAFYIAAGFWAYCIFHKYVHNKVKLF